MKNVAQRIECLIASRDSTALMVALRIPNTMKEM